MGRWFFVVLAILPFASACRSDRASPSSSPTPPNTTSPIDAARPTWETIAKGVTMYHETRTDLSGAAIAWSVARVDLDQVSVFARRPDDRKLGSLGRDPDVLFAVNGGFFEPDGTPSGLLVSNAQAISAWQRRGGSGTLVVRAKHASVVGEAPRDVSGVDLAMQGGPRLVEEGGTLGIHGDDGKRAERTAVCVRRAGRELDLVVAHSRPGDGPGLLQLGQWLTRPLAPLDVTGCEVALNLDGGPSTGMVAAGLSKERWLLPRGPVPWALVVIADRNALDLVQENAPRRDPF